MVFTPRIVFGPCLDSEPSKASVQAVSAHSAF